MRDRAPVLLSARIGLAAALATLALDQASKLYLLFWYDLPLREPVRVAPFLDLLVVWNRGISYGLMQQDSQLGRWVLVAVSLAAALGLSAWIRRNPRKCLPRPGTRENANSGRPCCISPLQQS